MSRRVDFESLQDADRLTIRVLGDIDLYSVATLKQEVTALLEDTRTEAMHVIVDLEIVESIDSSGMALLANMERRLKEEGRGFAIANVNRRVSDTLRIAGLARLLPVN